MALNAQIILSILAHETSAGDLSRTLRATPASYALSLTDGTGANQSQIVWSDSRTVTTSSDDLRLKTLADTRDGAVAVVAFSNIKLVYVRNTSASATLAIGGATGVTAFAGLPIGVPLQIAPGGCYLYSCPGPDGATAGVGIETVARFAAVSGSCSYDIILIGEGSVT
jgi:hypothetical protein